MLTTRPWWRAPLVLRHRPSIAVVAALGGVLVGIVAATPTMFRDSVGSGAVQTQWERGCPGDIAPHVSVLGTSAFGLIDDDSANAVAQRVAGFGAVDTAKVSLDLNFVNGETRMAGALLSRPDAVEQLDVVTEADAGDVWLSELVAQRLGVRAGQSVEVAWGDNAQLPGAQGLPAAVIIRGTFRDMTTGPLDDYWCGVDRELRAPTMFTDAVPPPKAIVDPSALATFSWLLPARINLPFATPPRTLAQAQAATGAIGVLQAELAESASATATKLGFPEPPARAVQVIENLTRITERAVAVKRAVGVAVRPLALLSLACALAVVAALGAMWTRVKRNDVVALTSMGVAPGWIGVKAALETVLAVMLGAVAGAALGWLALAAYAPSTDLEPGTFWDALGLACAAAAAAAVLIGATAAVTSRSVLRAVARRVPAIITWFPVEVVLAVLAWRSFRSFRHGSLVDVRDSDTVVGVSALAFPLLCFAAAGVLLARLWSVAVRRSSRPLRWVPAGLATRRLQHTRRFGAVLVGLGSLAVAVAVYGAGLVASLDYTTTAKAKVFVGADLRIPVSAEVPGDLPGATQTMFIRNVDYAGIDADLLAVDPRTFADVTFWDESFADRPLAELLGELAAVPTAAVVTGDLPTAGELRNPRGAGGLRIDRATRASVFPGMKPNRPLVVVGLDAGRASGLNFEKHVLANGEARAWLQRLADAGASPLFAVSADRVIDVSELLFASWTFVFVRALGVFVGGLVVVALFLQLIARQRQQALGFGILRRMGISSAMHRLALALEVLALAAAMCVAGAAVSLWVARLVVPRLDPMASIPPPPLMVVPLAAIGVLVVVMVASAALGSAVAQASGERVNLAEALRDE